MQGRTRALIVPANVLGLTCAGEMVTERRELQGERLSRISSPKRQAKPVLGGKRRVRTGAGRKQLPSVACRRPAESCNLPPIRRLNHKTLLRSGDEDNSAVDREWTRLHQNEPLGP